MTSTSSRSRASTRISRPNMAAPTSARFAGDLPCAAFFFVISVVLLMLLFLLCGWRRGPNKKPTTVSSRGFLSKSYLTTSADGVVFYDDDYQGDLSNMA